MSVPRCSAMAVKKMYRKGQWFYGECPACGAERVMQYQDGEWVLKAHKTAKTLA